MRVQRSCKVSWKPGRRDSGGQRFGSVYSGKEDGGGEGGSDGEVEGEAGVGGW